MVQSAHLNAKINQVFHNLTKERVNNLEMLRFCTGDNLFFQNCVRGGRSNVYIFQQCVTQFDKAFTTDVSCVKEHINVSLISKVYFPTFCTKRSPTYLFFYVNKIQKDTEALRILNEPF